MVGLLPFVPSIYEGLTEPSLHFVYQVDNERNPIDEWNRQLEKMFRQLDPEERKHAENLAAPLLRKIGSEIYRALPALLAGAGVRPAETSTVTILNVAAEELRDIRVHFTGCEGFDSYMSWPDSAGSSGNPRSERQVKTDQVTIRYDRLPPSVNRTESQAIVRFFGERTSACKPTVEAIAAGRPAIGRQVVLADFRNEETWDKYNSQRRADLFFKIVLAVGLIYVYRQVQNLARRPSNQPP